MLNNPLKYTDPSGYTKDKVEEEDLIDFQALVNGLNERVGFGGGSGSGLYIDNSGNMWENGDWVHPDYAAAVYGICIYEAHQTNMQGTSAGESYAIFENGETNIITGKILARYNTYGVILEGIRISDGTFPTFASRARARLFISILNGTFNFNSLKDFLGGLNLAGLPVLYSLGIDLDAVAGIGVDSNPISVGFVLQGIQRGKLITFGDFGTLTTIQKKKIGFALGFDLSVGIERTFYWFTGDNSSFDIYTWFEGNRWEINIGFNYLGVDLGMAVVIGELKKGERVIGFRTYGGAGLPFPLVNGNVNRGETILY